MTDKQKRIAVINDISGYGRCSLAVMLPIISCLKAQACPLPTAILSNHTGFPSEYKFDFTDHMGAYAEAWGQLGIQFDGIMTGYMNYDRQVRETAAFIEHFAGKDTMIFVDPSMADHGSLYRGFTMAHVGLIRELLVKKATMIKPNLTEACLLTGTDYQEIIKTFPDHTMRRLKAALINMVKRLQEMGPGKVIITGIERHERFMNVVADGDDIRFLAVRKAGDGRPGTGDIFSSIVCTSVVQGMSLERAVKKAQDFICKAIRVSEEQGVPVNEGTAFELILDKLACTMYDQIKQN
ncbi:MAG: pyridoxamine kinase [Eubacteriales bacterium]|nr:pyridoxamine kinase [Eubacteriales bacterium]